MRIDWVKCDCDNGYRGPYGTTCPRCEGGGMREEVVGEPGDCKTCQGFGKIAVVNMLLPCPAECGSAGYEEI